MAPPLTNGTMRKESRHTARSRKERPSIAFHPNRRLVPLRRRLNISRYAYGATTKWP